jgi:hypothetical protein
MGKKKKQSWKKKSKFGKKKMRETWKKKIQKYKKKKSKNTVIHSDLGVNISDSCTHIFNISI